MENQETNLDEVLTNQELKKKHWKSIKKEFIDKIPKQFNIEVKGLDDDCVYYHPTITLTEGFYIHCQCDINNKQVYGFSLKSNRDVTANGLMYTPSISLWDEKFEYVLNNYTKILEKLIAAENEMLKIYSLIGLLQETANKISYSVIEEIIDKNELKKSINSLEQVVEYLENKRY